MSGMDTKEKAASTEAPAVGLTAEEDVRRGETRCAPRSVRCAEQEAGAEAPEMGGKHAAAGACDPAACTQEAHAEGPKHISEYLAVFREPITRRVMTLGEVRRALLEE